MDFRQVFIPSLETAVQIGVAVLLFALRLPKKSRFPLRCALFLMGMTALITTAMSLIAGSVDEMPFSVLALFAGVLIYSLLGIPLLFDASVWAALFCATSGYTMQNLASGIAGGAMALFDGSSMPRAAGLILQTIIFALIYTVVYNLVAKHADDGIDEVEHNGTMVAMFIAVIVAVIGFDIEIKGLSRLLGLGEFLVLRIVHSVVCCFILFAEFEIRYSARLSADMTAISQLAADERRQYRLSRETIEAINIKCHDIRHQIRGMTHESGSLAQIDPAVVDEMARVVDVYDSRVSTGNDALDVILTEKSLMCESRGITLSCMADGNAVSFMAPADIYSLFGNALDNAIEAAEQLGDPDRKRISLTLLRKKGITSLHIENYCDEKTIPVDGNLHTSKPNKLDHGFGIASMRATAERYGGTLVYEVKDGIFILDIALVAAPSSQ